MKNKKGWHKLKDERKKVTPRDDRPVAPQKPPAQTDSPGGSRQGNAGMEKDTEGAHR